jgi:hypothetical protein
MEFSHIAEETLIGELGYFVMTMCVRVYSDDSTRLVTDTLLSLTPSAWNCRLHVKDDEKPLTREEWGRIMSQWLESHAQDAGILRSLTIRVR